MLIMGVMMVGITFATCDLLIEGMEIKYLDPASTIINTVAKFVTFDGRVQTY